jgi:hypothetical protein
METPPLSSSEPKSAGQRLTRAEIDAALNAMSDADWRRLEVIAASLCAGIAALESEDLLQEAITKFLAGDRVWPAGLPPIVVFENVMHSIASNTRKRAEEGPIDEHVEVDPLETGEESANTGSTVLSKTTVTAEDMLSWKQQIAAVYAAVAGDEDLENLAAAWAMGVRGKEAWTELGWTENKYEAQRKRLTRRLDKLGADGSKK